MTSCYQQGFCIVAIKSKAVYVQAMKYACPSIFKDQEILVHNQKLDSDRPLTPGNGSDKSCGRPGFESKLSSDDQILE